LAASALRFCYFSTKKILQGLQRGLGVVGIASIAQSFCYKVSGKVSGEVSCEVHLSWSYSFPFLDELFFASMKQKWTAFCTEEAV
jgi:hypothetical protein